ncbi:mycothiol synthase [Saccharopolyspora erythraea]|uniref:mycothiol synthase n=1 Tax=Saccharopolyspora erythraea TaxID=1836 RepID=UPI001BF00E5F|nr:mycothiol synthase [Saccharopolyspora erythraea]QUH05424.1 mycothiol synthase [Saccharopolyspora erythraea]
MQLTWRNGLDEAEAAEVMALLQETEQADGVAPVGEHVILRLKAHLDVVHQIEPVQADVPGSEHFIVRDSGGELAGYAHVDTAEEKTAGQLVAELAVHPRHRRRGAGARLVEALLDRADLPVEPSPDDTDTARLRIWSHGEHPGALRLAERYGLVRARELWRMGRSLDAELAEAELPPDVTIRAFRTGVDEPAVVRVNHRAFSWHPEQGAMTEDDLRVKEREDWFDPAGFLLAVDSRDTLLGFHWTKIHPDGTGEVYVVGVDPDTQGNGLGRSLTVAGLRHLQAKGCGQVMLYVEADNTAAVKVYQRLEFERWDTDVQFGR